MAHDEIMRSRKFKQLITTAVGAAGTGGAAGAGHVGGAAGAADARGAAGAGGAAGTGCVGGAGGAGDAGGAGRAGHAGVRMCMNVRAVRSLMVSRQLPNNDMETSYSLSNLSL